MTTSIAPIRFGYGYSLARSNRMHQDDVLGQLDLPDPNAHLDTATRAGMFDAANLFREVQRSSRDAGEKTPEHKAFLKSIRETHLDLIRKMVMRSLSDDAPFRERLNWFWLDHFTVEPKGQMLRLMIPSYVENAIRPNVTGRFADLLWAAISHPVMLFYLDNQVSRGPNSKAAKGGEFGLNENLGRELLELHTLGSNGGYTQNDVTELAKLLTGLRFTNAGKMFSPHFAEPGPETILGKSYGSEIESLDHIRAFMEDISVHPQTAQYLAQKLATHFISDTPNPDLISHMADAYLRADGSLTALYGAMLEHQAAWGAFGAKVKQPFDFYVSGLRALGVTPDDVGSLDTNGIVTHITQPLAQMGQPLFRAGGPDGWPEHAEAWITATGLASRVSWAAKAAQNYGGGRDPRETMEQVLGDFAGDALRWAVPKASNRIEGLALILASPEFNRR